jgi:Ala-tRNA(Pro) deacylase
MMERRNVTGGGRSPRSTVELGSATLGKESTMSLREVEEFLREKNVKYRTVHHSQAFSSHEIAQAAHVPGRRLAKVTMVKVDGSLAMAVLPASEMVDVKALGKVLGGRKVAIAAEEDFADRFPGCEVGAMPPFGNLWGMPVYVSDGFTTTDAIAFEAGSHRELLEMPYGDFIRLVEPKVVHFAA